jgi:putative ABC transport system substrate-binding protein
VPNDSNVLGPASKLRQSHIWLLSAHTKSGGGMKRRSFIVLVGGAALAPAAWPRALHAQKRGKRIPRVGIIEDAPVWQSFRDAMRDAGYIDGQTIAYEYRSSSGDPARLAAAAAELVTMPVDVIAAYGTPPARAAKAATSTIPIVFISVGDPIRAGLVQSFAHPGGNATGNTILASDLSPKRLQLIKEVIPPAKHVALLWNPDNFSNATIRDELGAAAPGLGLTFTAVEARNARDLDLAFATLAGDHPDAVLVTSDPIHQANIQKIISFLFRYGLPGMFQTRDNVVAGGLMSYGASFRNVFRHGASYVEKILAGTKPSDLPVQPSDHFELVINLKTAKAIGLQISDKLLLRADEVIE